MAKTTITILAELSGISAAIEKLRVFQQLIKDINKEGVKLPHIGEAPGPTQQFQAAPPTQSSPVNNTPNAGQSSAQVITSAPRNVPLAPSPLWDRIGYEQNPRMVKHDPSLSPEDNLINQDLARGLAAWVKSRETPVPTVAQAFNSPVVPQTSHNTPGNTPTPPPSGPSTGGASSGGAGLGGVPPAQQLGEYLETALPIIDPMLRHAEQSSSSLTSASPTPQGRGRGPRLIADPNTIATPPSFAKEHRHENPDSESYQSALFDRVGMNMSRSTSRGRDYYEALDESINRNSTEPKLAFVQNYASEFNMRPNPAYNQAPRDPQEPLQNNSNGSSRGVHFAKAVTGAVVGNIASGNLAGAVGGAATALLPELGMATGPAMLATAAIGVGVSSFNQYMDSGMALSDLAKQTITAGDSLEKFQAQALSAGATMGYSATQVAQVLTTLGNGLGNLGTSGLIGMGTEAMGFSRGMGVPVNSVASYLSQAGQLGLLGTSPSANSAATFLNLTAQATDQGDMQGRTQQVMDEMTSVAQTVAQTALVIPNQIGMAEAVAGLGATQNRLLQGAGGATLLNQATQGIANPGLGAAGRQMELEGFSNAGFTGNYTQSIWQSQQGAFAPIVNAQGKTTTNLQALIGQFAGSMGGSSAPDTGNAGNGYKPGNAQGGNLEYLVSNELGTSMAGAGALINLQYQTMSGTGSFTQSQLNAINPSAQGYAASIQSAGNVGDLQKVEAQITADNPNLKNALPVLTTDLSKSSVATDKKLLAAYLANPDNSQVGDLTDPEKIASLTADIDANLIKLVDHFVGGVVTSNPNAPKVVPNSGAAATQRANQESLSPKGPTAATYNAQQWGTSEGNKMVKDVKSAWGGFLKWGNQEVAVQPAGAATLPPDLSPSNYFTPTAAHPNPGVTVPTPKTETHPATTTLEAKPDTHSSNTTLPMAASTQPVGADMKTALERLLSSSGTAPGLTPVTTEIQDIAKYSPPQSGRSTTPVGQDIKTDLDKLLGFFVSSPSTTTPLLEATTKQEIKKSAPHVATAAEAWGTDEGKGAGDWIQNLFDPHSSKKSTPKAPAKTPWYESVWDDTFGVAPAYAGEFPPGVNATDYTNPDATTASTSKQPTTPTTASGPITTTASTTPTVWQDMKTDLDKLIGGILGTGASTTASAATDSPATPNTPSAGLYYGTPSSAIVNAVNLFGDGGNGPYSGGSGGGSGSGSGGGNTTMDPMGNFAGLFASVSSQDNLPAHLLQAVASHESGINPNVVGDGGGIMQLEPATAAGLGVTNRSDPTQSITGGGLLLNQLIGQYQQKDPSNYVTDALEAYYAGSGYMQGKNAANIVPHPEAGNTQTPAQYAAQIEKMAGINGSGASTVVSTKASSDLNDAAANIKTAADVLNKAVAHLYGRTALNGINTGQQTVSGFVDGGGN